MMIETSNNLLHPKTAEDLCGLMNAVKMRECNHEFWPFTMSQLSSASNPRKNYLYYSYKTIPKRSGGIREISSPLKTQKILLHIAGRMLLDYYEPGPSVTGFVRGRSVKDNAARHIAKNYVYNADLKDFFPSIVRSRVEVTLMRAPFSFGKEAAHILSGICCAHADLVRQVEAIDKEIRCARLNGHDKRPEDYSPCGPASLPQGSPASPILSNAVCIRLDRRLEGLAKRFEVTYSRYADDITFSSNHNVFKEGYSFLKEFRKIVADEGFKLNEAKLRLQKKGQRQEVTGLIVNSKVNVCRKYIRSIGSILHIWEKYGLDAAYARFLKHNTCNDKLKTHLVETIRGRLAYISMIRGKDDSVWKRLNDRFLALKEQFESEGIKGNPIQYLHSWTIKRFEQLSGMTLRYGEVLHDYYCPPQTWKAFFIEHKGLKTEVCLSKYCYTRLKRVLEKEDPEEFERLKSEFHIGLCFDGRPSILIAALDFESEIKKSFREHICLQHERRLKKLVHTYSNNPGIYWKVFRRPPSDIEDLPI